MSQIEPFEEQSSNRQSKEEETRTYRESLPSALREGELAIERGAVSSAEEAYLLMAKKYGLRTE